MKTSIIRLVARNCRHSRSITSALLALSVVVVLSLMLLLHAVHLLHSDRMNLHGSETLHVFPTSASEGTFLDRWVDRDITLTDRNLSGQKCLHPHLDPHHPSIMQFYNKEPAVDCSSAMADWVYVTNGTFRISRRARRLYGKITCEYAPMVRGSDFSARHAPHVKPMLDGSALQSDFFKVACVSGGGQRYMNIHSAVAWNPAVWARLRRIQHSAASSPPPPPPPPRPHLDRSRSGGDPGPRHPRSVFVPPPVSPEHGERTRPHTFNSLNLSVFMFGFDSLSRMAWMRLLPRTRDYYLKALGGIELSGYNIVGDGTPAALLPILTGKMEEELPEARRGFEGASAVDNHPWIWRNFSHRGYVTAHAEDMASVGTFQYRMLGFKDQPTDHNMRTFYLAAERMYRHNPPLCLGSRPRHVNFMNWFRDLFDMYRDVPKFFFGFHSEMSHDFNNKVQALDDDLVAFLKGLEEKGHLNSTLLILMADHGARYNYIRATAQGKLEERMPYFSFRFPPWFKKVHPEIVRNMEINSNRLTTPFDIHETFLDLLNYTGTGMADTRRRGLSLFKEVPKERTCSHAGITPHWCACLEWQRVNQSDAFVVQAVQSAISAINQFTDVVRKECAELTVSEVTHSARYMPNVEDISVEKKQLTYRQSQQVDTSSTTEDSQPLPAVELYQVSFKTQPGRGHFEVTCSRDVTSGAFSVSAKDISRINKYGTQPKCIQDKMPHLRPYCYCLRVH
ncbi:uncharacterized protein LOC143275425 [Babylonia areolata]|uniref:uncharacterized protein LOC143275425 n=1 Tax=Babylonia areolata TaxID=304850 RepID=UPI003FD4782B